MQGMQSSRMVPVRAVKEPVDDLLRAIGADTPATNGGCSPHTTSAPWSHRALDRVFVAGYVATLAWLVHAVIDGLGASTLGWWLAPVALFFGYLAADFASGFVHWLADSYGTATMPILGPKFVAPFREHHVDPLAITRHDFFEANANNCLTTYLVMLPTLLFLPVDSTVWGALVGVFIFALSVGTLVTSMAHGWAHEPRPSALVSLLQRAGLVISPEHHARHHVAPHRDNYCITTGWLNGLLDRTRFFRGLEALFDRIGIPRGT